MGCLFVVQKRGDHIRKIYGVIYCATNIINDKKYIGQTIRGLNRRKNEHICLANNGSEWAIHQAIRKYGEDNFEWMVIDSANNQEELDEKEIYWIDYYNTFYEGGYNMAIGGMSNSYGSPDEMSLMRGGRPFLVYDLEGNFIKETISQKEFAEEIGVSQGSPNNVLAGRKNTIGGFILIFKDEFSEEELNNKLTIANRFQQPFAVFDKNKNFVGIWTDKSKCAEELKVSLRTIQSQLYEVKIKKRIVRYAMYFIDEVPLELKYKIRDVM